MTPISMVHLQSIHGARLSCHTETAPYPLNLPFIGILSCGIGLIAPYTEEQYKTGNIVMARCGLAMCMILSAGLMILFNDLNSLSKE